MGKGSLPMTTVLFIFCDNIGICFRKYFSRENNDRRVTAVKNGGFVRITPRPSPNDAMGLMAFRCMVRMQTESARQMATQHHHMVSSTCPQCDGSWTQCKRCLSACTDQQPGNRIYNDWVMCGACDGCRGNLASFESEDECEDES